METKNKVLIIDDEAPLLHGLSIIMERHGYQVITANNGEEGLRLARAESPNVIISDVMMPPPNGFELREILNKSPETASIPFIFLTARIDQEDKIRGIIGGADDYITKPFNRTELVARVDAILRRKAIERKYGREEGAALAEEKMEHFKQEVLQNFHHEIRTPIANILLPLELAISKKFEDPEEQINFIQSALSNLERLHSLVEDFILLTNIDNGNLNSIGQEIDIENGLLGFINKRLQRYEEKNLEFNVTNNINEVIFAPRNELKRAVLHLVDNAFKFVPEGGRVGLELVVENGMIQFLVSDNGPGIPLEQRENVFDRYFQISQGDTRRFEGLGVGLTIARAIARSLGGDVTIVDTTEGTTTVMKFPPLENTFGQ